MVMDLCAATWPTAKASMLLDHRTKSTWCDLDADGLSAEEPHFLLELAPQGLTSNSEIMEIKSRERQLESSRKRWQRF